MQEKDVIAKEYLQDPGRFADLLNAEWFQGKQVLGPEHIREKKGRSARIHRKAGRIRTAETTEDVAKEIVLGGRTIWVMVEAQCDTHFAMPVRIANEESMRYQEQWRNIRNQHRESKDLKGTEYLSGFGKSDRLIPVVTLVLHLGGKPWEGAGSLKELMDLDGWPGEVRGMVEDQRLHLIDVRRYPHPEVFRTDLCCVFGFLKNSGQKDALKKFVDCHQEAFSHLREDAYDFITVMAGDRELLQLKEKSKIGKGEYDMCQAIREMIQEGYQEGHQQGILQGEITGRQNGIRLMRQIYRLQASGADRREIAKACGIRLEELNHILEDEI